MRCAVVDVGSNSLILTVFQSAGARWEPVFEVTRVTGLGLGTKLSGRIADDSAEASLLALQEFQSLAREQGADRWVAGGTMALRLAENRGQFLRGAAEQGTPVTVLSGELEAGLGFLSVVDDPTWGGVSKVSIVDPGGHSTEVTVASQVEGVWRKDLSRSFSFGALGLRETALVSPSPPPAERLAALAQLDDALGFSLRPGESGTVVTLGATGTNLVSIRDGLLDWAPGRVHGATLTYEEVSRAVSWLCGMDDSGRAAVVGLEKGREGTIHAGALVLERCLFSLRAEECRVSVRGWRHALLSHLDLVPGLRPEALA